MVALKLNLNQKAMSESFCTTKNICLIKIEENLEISLIMYLFILVSERLIYQNLKLMFKNHYIYEYK